MSDDPVPTAEQRRVFVHVGAPKTGTTFLQTVFWDHRDVLREQGVLFPGERYDDHFFAAVDLQDLAFNDQPRPEAAGAWDRMVGEVAEWSGDTVLSHDVFASASPDQARKAVADLAPAEVHVVMTVRDPARLLPSHWQEDVKHGETVDLDSWFALIRGSASPRWSWRWFWLTEDVPEVLARWAEAVPPEHVHVVTVPPPGAARDVLWRRFCSVVGVDPAIAADLQDVEHTNQGLGVHGVDLLRRVNAELDERLAADAYEHTVKGVLAHETLARVPTGSRVPPPTDSADFVSEMAQRFVAGIRAGGYEVVGDLADLEPAADAAESDDGPVGSTDAQVADTAARGLAELMVSLHHERVGHRDEVDRLRAEVGRLIGDNDRRQAELDELHARMRRIDQHPLVKLRYRTRRGVARLLGR